jgi:hypothetical protein
MQRGLLAGLIIAVRSPSGQSLAISHSRLGMPELFRVDRLKSTKARSNDKKLSEISDQV